MAWRTIIPKNSYTLKNVILLLLALATVALPAWAQGESDSLAVRFEPGGGFFDHPLEVALFAPGAEAIYYTLDGSLPTSRSKRYTASFRVAATTVVRAVAFFGGGRGSYCGQTYFFREPTSTFPVVSIGITSSLLFDPYKGIFVAGPQAVDSSWFKPGANFWSRRELTGHIDIFESDGSRVFSSLAGIRLFGGMSRLFPQKSLAIIARKQYGETRVRHDIFGPDEPDNFKFLVLRNGGSDFGKTHFRDELMTGLVAHWDLETQAARPAHVYINGKYWGIYNIREKINRYFVAAHSKGVDKDSIDLLEHQNERRRGSRAHYRRMIAFMERYDLRQPEHYARVMQWMDVDNFMQYQIAQIYFDNQDAGGNIKYWRPQKPDGRWRWILYDTDWGFGLHDPRAYRNNSLAFHTEPNGPHWPNPPWSTFILRKLLQNEGFRYRFVNRFCDHLNTTFEPDRVAAFIDSLYAVYEPEMPRHLGRWRFTRQEWQAEVAVLYDFARQRPAYMRRHLQDYFRTGDPRQIEVAASPGGKVLVNEYLQVGSRGMSGYYFANCPVSLRALPAYGYRFARWEGDADDPLERTMLLKLKTDRAYRLKAVFEPFRDPHEGQVVINEICARNRQTGDWIEIHNRSDKTIDLRAFVLTDFTHEFIFPEATLAPHDYLVVCRDAAKFRQVFPEAYQVVGGLDFGLHKREERLGLYSPLGALVDSIGYRLPPQDSAFTISLLLPDLDNADPENWEARPGKGTPNAPNPYYLESRVRLAQARWLRWGLGAGLLLLALYAWRRGSPATEREE